MFADSLSVSVQRLACNQVTVAVGFKPRNPSSALKQSPGTKSARVAGDSQLLSTELGEYALFLFIHSLLPFSEALEICLRHLLCPALRDGDFPPGYMKMCGEC